MIEIQLLTSMDAEPLFVKPWPYTRQVKLYRAGEDVVDFVFDGGKKTTKTVYTVPKGRLLVIPVNPTMWHDHEAMKDLRIVTINGEDVILELLRKNKLPIERVKIRYL